ncbi:hypothetical protein [Tenacibaculum sp. 190524A02b]
MKKSTFILTNGEVSVSNTDLKIDVKTGFNVQQFIINISLYLLFSWSIIIDYIDKGYTASVFGYVKLVLVVVVFAALVFACFYKLFKTNFKSKIDILEIKKIEVEEIFLEPNINHLKIYDNKNRVKVLSFRVLENQVKPFLEFINNKNSRIEIKYI